MTEANNKVKAFLWWSFLLSGLASLAVLGRMSLWFELDPPLGTWVAICSAVVFPSLVLSNKVNLRVNEAAQLLGGFVLNIIELLPSFFYKALGIMPDVTPRPFAREIVSCSFIVSLLLVAWIVFVATRLGGFRAFVALLLGVLQGWIAFVSLFINSGLVLREWL